MAEWYCVINLFSASLRHLIRSKHEDNNQKVKCDTWGDPSADSG